MKTLNDVGLFINNNKNIFKKQGHIIKNANGCYLLAYRSGKKRRTFSIGKSPETAGRVLTLLTAIKADHAGTLDVKKMCQVIFKINSAVRKLINDNLEKIGYHLHGWTLRKRRNIKL